MALSDGTGACIFGCAGPELSANEAAFFRDAQPLGFILFARNLENPAQILRLTTALRAAVGWNAPVLIDQEGGRVERMGAPHWSTWAPPLDQVAQSLARHGAEAAKRGMYLRYRVIASELLASGIDVNCAPCADIAFADTHPVLRNRCYSEDAKTVADIARSVAQAHLDTGVLPVMKHMPGHGRASLDSHKDLPRVTAAAETLTETDFAPFRALSDLPMGMSAHVVYESLGETGPATTSVNMIRLIREDIGFQGLLMTDDLSMQALSGTVAERSRASLAAGIDVILHCNGELAEMQDVAGEAGALTPAARARADAALALRDSGSPVDIQSAKAELEALL